MKTNLLEKLVADFQKHAGDQTLEYARAAIKVGRTEDNARDLMALLVLTKRNGEVIPHPFAYLYKANGNSAKSEGRSRSARLRRERIHFDHHKQDKGSSDADSEAIQRLRRGLSLLAPEDLGVLIERFGSDLTFKQIAEAEDFPNRNLAHRRFVRALDNLRSLMGVHADMSDRQFARAG